MSIEDLKFTAKIISGVTHEINNVLASIREISGLLDDILAGTDEKVFQKKDKFLTSLQKIQNQVKRGILYTNKLNKFSHLPDNNILEFDVNEISDHLIFLMERFARIKNIKLKIIANDQTLNASTSPFHLEMALFLCLNYLINNLSDGNEITINSEKVSNKAILNIRFTGAEIDKASLFNTFLKSDAAEDLKNTMRFVDGSFEIDDDRTFIKLIFPDSL